VGSFGDIAKYHELTPFALLVGSLVGFGLIALVASAFTNGGLLEVIGSGGDGRTFMHRFFRGGGRFPWRFVRLALLAYIPGAIVAGIVAAGLGAITTPLSDSEWEPAGLFWTCVNFAVVGLVGLWFLLALGYARIRIAHDGGHGMFRVYLYTLGFVAKRLFATYTIGLLGVVAVVVLLLAYVAHESVWTASNWGAIWVLIITQQVVMLLRSGVRVAQVSAEWHYFGAMALAAAAPAAPVESPAPVIDGPPAPYGRRGRRAADSVRACRIPGVVLLSRQWLHGADAITGRFPSGKARRTRRGPGAALARGACDTIG
jgi:hypothetical protein